MAGGTTEDPEAGKDRPAPSSREVRLAEALRANLRRRKAGARSQAAGPPSQDPDSKDPV
jgi:hypothetical protein